MWILGVGNKIKLSEDPIMGSSNFYKLLDYFLDSLHQKVLYSLAHVGYILEEGALK